MMKRRREFSGPLAVAAALAIVLSGGPRAEEVTGPAAPEAGVEETVQIVLVQVPLLGTDRQGNPVTDLRADEMEVKAGRRKLPVEYLEPLRPEAPDSGPLPPVRLYVDAPGGWQVPLRSTGADAEYVVLFLDVVNDDRLRRQEAIDEIVAFAKTDLNPAAQVAVLSFDGALHLDLPFTNDRKAIGTALLQAWSRTAARPQLDLQSRVRKLLQGFDECVLPGRDTLTRTADSLCLRDVSREYADEVRPRAEGLLAAMKDMVQFLGGLRGRKTVVAMSHGVEVDAIPVIAEAVRSVLGNASQVAEIQLYLGFGDRPELKMQELQRLAVQNKVTLHFLDRSAAPSSDFGARSGRLMYPGTAPAKVAFEAPQADLEELAATTGGIFLASTDVTAGLRQVERVREGAYELGYRLDQYLSDKELGKVKISTTRKGVRLSHRRGVYADASSATRPAAGQIVIRPHTAGPAKDAIGAPYRFAIEFDPKQIGYEEGETEAAANFTLFVTVEDDRGRERVGSFHLISHAYPLDLWRAGDVAPVTLRGWVELPPGRFTLRALVRSTATGWEGEIVEAVSVPEADATGRDSGPARGEAGDIPAKPDVKPFK